MLSRRLLPSLLTPQGLVALLVFCAGLSVFLWRPLVEGQAAPSQVSLQGVQAQPTSSEAILLYTMNENLLISSSTQVLALPEESERRLEAILTALREHLRDEGLWPEALGAPQIFLVEAGRGGAVVLDFSVNESALPLVPVTSEWRLLESIRHTARHHAGVNRVALLINGQGRAVFLQHVALESYLD